MIWLGVICVLLVWAAVKSPGSLRIYRFQKRDRHE